MKTICLSLLVCLFTLSTPHTTFSADKSVSWKGIREQYTSFDQIEPVLVNKGSCSIYLNSLLWGMAQLKRFNEATHKWEAGEWFNPRTGTSDAKIPIEIEPGQSRRITIGWEPSVDKFPPNLFVADGGGNSIGSKRSLQGRYKIIIQYALEPWTLAGRPRLRYVAESPEFYIAGQTPLLNESLDRTH